MWLAKIRSKIVDEWRDLMEQPAPFSDDWVNRILDTDYRRKRLTKYRRTWWSWANDALWFAMLFGFLLASIFFPSGLNVEAWRITDCLMWLSLLILSIVAKSMRHYEVTFLKMIERLSNEGKLHER